MRAAAPAAGRFAALRAEDLLLAVWNLVAVPIGVTLGGGWMSGERAPLVGVVEALAIVGVIVAVATRTPGAQPLAPESFRGWVLSGPLIGAVALVGDSAGDRLGLDVAPLGLAAFVAVVAAFVAADRLPVLPEARRRLLVAPFVFVTAGHFADVVASILDGLDPSELARALFDGSSAAPELAGAAGILVVGLLGGAAVFYAMLVLAPRELAAPEPHPGVWLVRFVVFVVSAVVGAGSWVLL